MYLASPKGAAGGLKRAYRSTSRLSADHFTRSIPESVNISEKSRIAPEDVRETLIPEQHAALLALASRAARLDWLEYPVQSLVTALHGPLAALPAQLAFVAVDSAFGQWVAIASLAEQRALYEAATDILNGVRTAVERAGETTIAPQEALEFRAICWTRRGRVARTLGHHDDALECYVQARRLVKELPWRDARPLAELGLGALAAARGNYPTVARHATNVLKQRPPLPGSHRLGAHMLMALAQRKRGALIEALLNGWAAHDLVPRGDVRALEVLISLSEIAIELHDLDAAEMGFASVLGHDCPVRVRVAALIGAVASCLLLAEADASVEIRTRLNRYGVLLQALLDIDLAPHDECRVLFALAGIDRQSGEPSRAAECVERATSIARQVGLFEQQFRLDKFMKQLMRTTPHQLHNTADHAVSARARPATTFGRHPALSRLFEKAQ